MFIDRVKVHVRAGKGGKGCVSLHREKFVPLGGPDGGNGGKGGDVIFYVDPNENTLVTLHARSWYAAGDGENGAPNNKTGASGKDIRLPVAPGSVIRNAATGEMICDLVGEEDEAIVAAGGRGGRGNATFATSTNQTPRKAQPGEPGVELDLLVELKIVADIGLVGFPNAGKSTLLNAITSAKAKIGDYPFTTLHPVLGTLPLEPEEESHLTRIARQGGATTRARPRIVIADIPGIIEGAHEGAGLGLEFLRHIERTLALLVVLDVSTGREHEPVDAYRTLLDEIQSHNASLLSAPRLVLLSKVDDAPSQEEVDQVTTQLKEAMEKETPLPTPGDIYPISALFGMGIEPLRQAIVELTIRARGLRGAAEAQQI
jgi:GTP-binding protein